MSRFVTEVEECENSICVSVKHENADNDPCAGQNQVVGELYKSLFRLGLSMGSSKVNHSGGCAHVYVNKKKG